ncbi:hypothetical protein BC940DRAFT_306435 [Gongronella butleri]|nr:hypothetical protein BC940DRAFT_306435 [Gongronella butleri]
MVSLPLIPSAKPSRWYDRPYDAHEDFEEIKVLEAQYQHDSSLVFETPYPFPIFSPMQLQLQQQQQQFARQHLGSSPSVQKTIIHDNTHAPSPSFDLYPPFPQHGHHSLRDDDDHDHDDDDAMLLDAPVPSPMHNRTRGSPMMAMAGASSQMTPGSMHNSFWEQSNFGAWLHPANERDDQESPDEDDLTLDHAYYHASPSVRHNR